MANTIQLKRNAVADTAPVLGDLSEGEVAINLVDGIIYFRDAANAVRTLGIIKSGASADETARFNNLTGRWESTSALKIDASGDITLTGDVSAASSNITASAFIGDGSQLTAVDAESVDGLDSSQFLRSDTADTVAGALTFTASPKLNDSVSLSLGTGSDASLYFDGTDSRLDLTAGDFIVRDGVTTRFTFDRAAGDFTATGTIDATTALNVGGSALTTGFTRFRTLTQATYDALTPDANTLYFING